jgi:hypothetical protein
MNATDAFREYMAFKAHFERPNYSYFKYNGKVRTGDYEKRKDKNFFFRASRAYNKISLKEYYLANFLQGTKHISGFNKDVHMAWKRKIVRLNIVFEKDIKTVKELIDERDLRVKDAFIVKAGEHPIMFRLLLGEYIQLESFVMITTLIPSMLDRYDTALADDPVWFEWSHKIRKYSPFLVRMIDNSWNFREILNQNLLNTTVVPKQ